MSQCILIPFNWNRRHSNQCPFTNIKQVDQFRRHENWVLGIRWNRRRPFLPGPDWRSFYRWESYRSAWKDGSWLTNSGEYGGWSRISTLDSFNFRTVICETCGWALSWSRIGTHFSSFWPFQYVLNHQKRHGSWRPVLPPSKAPFVMGQSPSGSSNPRPG